MAIEFQNLPPAEAIKYFQEKGYNTDYYSWKDAEPEMHHRAFMVAKVMEIDLLEDIRTEVDKAIAEGKTFEEFKRDLQPKLEAKGWWGRKEVRDPKTGELREVQLGSTRRLRTIYDTNLRVAHAEGQWARIQKMKKMFPYLVYDGNNSADPRPEHSAWDGLCLPVDDPFWQLHYPPKAWGCKCRVHALTKGQYERRTDLRKDAPFEPMPQLWINDRTGQPLWVPIGVDPAFHKAPGGWVPSMLDTYRDRVNALPPEIQATVHTAIVHVDILDQRFPSANVKTVITRMDPEGITRQVAPHLRKTLLATDKAFVPYVTKNGFGKIRETVHLFQARYKISDEAFDQAIVDLYHKPPQDWDVTARRVQALLSSMPETQWQEDWEEVLDAKTKANARKLSILGMIDKKIAVTPRTAGMMGYKDKSGAHHDSD